MSNQMTGTQKFILAFTGLVVLGIGLSRISVAQQQPEQQEPGQGNFSLLKASEIQLVDAQGAVQMVFQAERNPPSYDEKGKVIEGPSIQLYGDGGTGCEIGNTSIIFWDQHSPEQHPIGALSFSKVFLGLSAPTSDGRVARLSLKESSYDKGGGGVYIFSKKPQKPPSGKVLQGHFSRIISPDAIQVIKGKDKE